MKLETKTVVKFYLVIVFALVGFGGLLAFWINTQNTSSDSQIVQTASAQSSWEMPNLGCRYRTGGGSCAQSEFQDGACNYLSSGQMCYCGNNGTDIQGANNWTYAQPNTGKRDVGCLVNGATLESICNGKAGQLVTPSSSQVSCRNPIRCPDAQVSNLTLQGVCVDNGQTINLSYAVSNGGNVLRQGTTNSTETGLQGGGFEVTFGGLTELRNRYPQYPNINFVSGPNGQTFRSGVSPNSTVRIEAQNCSATTTGTPTATPTATPTNPPSAPICNGLNLTYRDVNNQPQTVVSDNFLNVYRVYPGSQVTVNKLRLTNGQEINGFAMPFDVTCLLDNSCTTGGRNDGVLPNPQNTDSYFTQPGRVLQINGYSRQDKSGEDAVSCAARFQPEVVRVPQSPNIEITKTLTSPNFQPVGSTITFNINVKNTGDVDVRNFILHDEFDPTYLEFTSSTYRGQNLSPDTATGEILTNGRRRLAWSNMPPKSTQIANEDGILTIGESFTLTLTFRILKTTSAQLALENDNCGVVQGIAYRDNLGQDTTFVFNPRKESCAEFQSVTPAALNVSVTKQTLTPSVRVGNEIHFRAVITNSDAQRRSYADVDFTDQYDTRYLKPLRIVITASNGRVATVTGLLNTGTISLTDIQSRLDATGNALGGLAFGQTYSLELIYEATAPITSTCDTVFANAGDNSNPVNGGTSNQAQACAEITSPPPPNTGADIWLNLLMPLVAIAGTIVTRRFLV